MKQFSINKKTLQKAGQGAAAKQAVMMAAGSAYRGNPVTLSPSSSCVKTWTFLLHDVHPVTSVAASDELLHLAACCY